MHTLNHIYRTIWSDVLGTWIAVSEITKARGKRTGSSLLQALRIGGVSVETDDAHRHRIKPLVLALACCFAFNVQANPNGASVVSGNASFNTSGNTLTVTNTPGTIINWQNFSIGAGETTHFAQQSAASTVLNRVVTNNPSVILGTLSSNGQVYLVNANGIMFGAGSTVDVAGLVATTLNLSDNDFKSGRNNFTAVDGAGNITNSGSINARQGGQIYLIAPNVKNNGIIHSPNGEILLAAGNSVELVNSNDPDIRVRITAPAGNVTNIGEIVAEAGRIGLIGTVVRNTGIVSADSATMQGGKVVLRSSRRTEAGGTISANGTSGGNIDIFSSMQSGTVQVSGELQAEASGSGDGGFVETSAANVRVADSARVSTRAASGSNGNWLIDPTDFTIAATGGDMTGATLGTNLAGGNVTITAPGTGTSGNGDIFVNDLVTWGCTNALGCALTLNAWRNIYINQDITGTVINGTPQLYLMYGQGAATAGNTADYFLGAGAQVFLPAGINFHTTLGNTAGAQIDYTVITSLGTAGAFNDGTLQGMQGNLTGNYVLGADIDASTTNTWNFNGTTYDGFAPVGTSTVNRYSGHFDGLGHTITGLYINRSATNYVGLFGTTYTGTNAQIRNVGLVNASITGAMYVGGLVGMTGYDKGIQDSYVSGSTISGISYVGGLVGQNSFSTSISGSYTSGTTVTGTSMYVGGIAGLSYGNIAKSHASGVTVAGSTQVGGGVGYLYGVMSDSYVDSGAVTGANQTGGLIGFGTTSVNSHYDIGNVTINGASRVTMGGIYSAQFSDWLTNSLTLNIANYSANLVALGANNYGVSSAAGLRDMLGFADNAAYTFTLTGNIDLVNDAGLYIPYLAADFNGGGFTVSNLDLSLGPANDSVGFFGYVAAGGAVSNLTLDTALVNGGSNVGALVGQNLGSVTNAHVTGTSSVSGSNSVGGLVGYTEGNITNSDVTGATVSGSTSIGGLVGYASGATVNITNSFFSGGSVSGSSSVGGLVGRFWGGGSISGSHVSGATIIGGSVSASYAGGLVGQTFNSNVVNNYVDSGTVVSGYSAVGGLIGGDGGEGDSIVTGNTVTNVGVTGTTGVGGLFGNASGGMYSAGYLDDNHVVNSAVTGVTYVGGLVGWGDTPISNSSVTGTTVAGTNTVGGLVGYNGSAYTNTFSSPPQYTGGRISNSYVSGGTVSGTGGVGGLVGSNLGEIQTSFVSGVTVDGGSTSMAADAGGLVGSNSGVIANTYVSGGTVSGWSNVGGLVGTNNGPAAGVSFSYVSGGSVTGTTYVGGVVGYNYQGTVANNYWDSALAGGNLTNGIGYDFLGAVGTDTGAAGRTAAQLRQMSTFSGWDIANTGGAGATWRIYEGNTGPLLTFLLTQTTVTANDATRTYDATNYSGGNGYTTSVAGAVLLGTFGGTSQGALNAGSYVIDATGLYSDQFGYDITSYTNGTLTINPATLTITADSLSKYFGMTDPTLTYGVIGLQGSDTLPGILTGSLARDPGEAPGNYNINSGSLTLTSSNYTLTFVPGTFSIMPSSVAPPIDDTVLHGLLQTVDLGNNSNNDKKRELLLASDQGAEELQLSADIPKMVCR